MSACLLWTSVDGVGEDQDRAYEKAGGLKSPECLLQRKHMVQVIKEL